MLVTAAPGLLVPLEEKPRDYLTDSAEYEVPETAYYLRRLNDGDLLAVDPASAPATKPKKGAV